MAWWIWVLIALGCVLVIGAILVAIWIYVTIKVDSDNG